MRISIIGAGAGGHAMAAHLGQLDDHQLCVRRDGESSLPGDGLRLLTHDVRIDSLPRRRNHQAFERVLFLRRAEVGTLASKRIPRLSLDRRIADLRTAIGQPVSSLPADDPRRGAFGRLHALSTALMGIAVAGGLLLCYWETRE